mmetsp:Transcript_65448/g.155075  ORF Transcript_65448/g.155075 Transcript_65448/m.155075 type:complete len:201 (-) Transcript_65448:1037-1639(-)
MAVGGAAAHALHRLCGPARRQQRGAAAGVAADVGAVAARAPRGLDAAGPRQRGVPVPGAAEEGPGAGGRSVGGQLHRGGRDHLGPHSGAEASAQAPRAHLDTGARSGGRCGFPAEGRKRRRRGHAAVAHDCRTVPRAVDFVRRGEVCDQPFGAGPDQGPVRAPGDDAREAPGAGGARVPHALPAERGVGDGAGAPPLARR